MGVVGCVGAPSRGLTDGNEVATGGPPSHRRTAICRSTCGNTSAPGRIRTCGTRFRSEPGGEANSEFRCAATLWVVAHDYWFWLLGTLWVPLRYLGPLIVLPDPLMRRDRQDVDLLGLAKVHLEHRPVIHEIDLQGGNRIRELPWVNPSMMSSMSSPLRSAVMRANLPDPGTGALDSFPGRPRIATDPIAEQGSLPE